MEIPVYGLSGFGEVTELTEYPELGKLKIFKKIAAAAKLQKQQQPGNGFKKVVSRMKNAALRKKITEKHVKTLRGLEGIYNTSAAKIAAGTATPENVTDYKKAKILLSLESTDYDCYRLASIYMPYVCGFDDFDGGYLFPSRELAEIAAAGEEEFLAYANSPGATELGKIKIFKKIKKAVKKAAKAVGGAVKSAAKAVANTAKAAAKATVNTVKATANLTKAGIQAATGQGAKAKETLKKAGSQAKAAVTEPIKQAVKDTKELTQKTIINPTKTFVIDPIKNTVKIAGKVFKVIFVKLNPATILIRNSLRGLIALNFRGFATKLAVGALTQQQAAEAGYDSAAWEKAKKAFERVVKLYTKMGGKKDKIEKSIKNGAKRKPLFGAKKDTKVDLPPDSSDNEATLGDPATVAAMIAACTSALVAIAGWVAGIVANKKQEKKEKEEERKREEEKARNAELYETDVNGNPIVDEYGRPIPKGKIDADKAAAAAAAAAAQAPENADEKKKKTGLIIAIAAAAGVALLAMSGGKGKKRR